MYSPHKGHLLGALVSSLMCAWTGGWANSGDVGNFRRPALIMTPLWCCRYFKLNAIVLKQSCYWLLWKVHCGRCRCCDVTIWKPVSLHSMGEDLKETPGIANSRFANLAMARFGRSVKCFIFWTSVLYFPECATITLYDSLRHYLLYYGMYLILKMNNHSI